MGRYNTLGNYHAGDNLSEFRPTRHLHKKAVEAASCELILARVSHQFKS